MAFAWAISCTRCQFQQYAGLDAYCIYYWLGEDRFAPMPFVAAWCEGCLRVTIAEEVPDLETLTERSEAWLKWLRERGTEPGDQFYDRKQREFAHQLMWRKERTEPPRCLLCRSDSVSLLDLGDDPPLHVPHPGCLGQLRIERGWHYHTRVMWVYSVEGEYLGLGSGFEFFQPPKAPLPHSETGLRFWVDLGNRR